MVHEREGLYDMWADFREKQRMVTAQTDRAHNKKIEFIILTASEK